MPPWAAPSTTLLHGLSFYVHMMKPAQKNEGYRIRHVIKDNGGRLVPDPSAVSVSHIIVILDTPPYNWTDLSDYLSLEPSERKTFHELQASQEWSQDEIIFYFARRMDEAEGNGRVKWVLKAGWLQACLEKGSRIMDDSYGGWEVVVPRDPTPVRRVPTSPTVRPPLLPALPGVKQPIPPFPPPARIPSSLSSALVSTYAPGPSRWSSLAAPTGPRSQTPVRSLPPLPPPPPPSPSLRSPPVVNPGVPNETSTSTGSSSRSKIDQAKSGRSSETHAGSSTATTITSAVEPPPAQNARPRIPLHSSSLPPQTTSTTNTNPGGDSTYDRSRDPRRQSSVPQPTQLGQKNRDIAGEQPGVLPSTGSTSIPSSAPPPLPNDDPLLRPLALEMFSPSPPPSPTSSRRPTPIPMTSQGPPRTESANAAEGADRHTTTTSNTRQPQPPASIPPPPTDILISHEPSIPSGSATSPSTKPVGVSSSARVDSTARAPAPPRPSSAAVGVAAPAPPPPANNPPTRQPTNQTVSVVIPSPAPLAGVPPARTESAARAPAKIQSTTLPGHRNAKETAKQPSQISYNPSAQTSSGQSAPSLAPQAAAARSTQVNKPQSLPQNTKPAATARPTLPPVNPPVIPPARIVPQPKNQPVSSLQRSPSIAESPELTPPPPSPFPNSAPTSRAASPTKRKRDTSPVYVASSPARQASSGDSSERPTGGSKARPHLPARGSQTQPASEFAQRFRGTQATKKILPLVTDDDPADEDYRPNRGLSKASPGKADREKAQSQKAAREKSEQAGKEKRLREAEIKEKMKKDRAAKEKADTAAAEREKLAKEKREKESAEAVKHIEQKRAIDKASREEAERAEEKAEMRRRRLEKEKDDKIQADKKAKREKMEKEKADREVQAAKEKEKARRVESASAAKAIAERDKLKQWEKDKAEAKKLEEESAAQREAEKEKADAEVVERLKKEMSDPMAQAKPAPVQGAARPIKPKPPMTATTARPKLPSTTSARTPTSAASLPITSRLNPHKDTSTNTVTSGNRPTSPHTDHADTKRRKVSHNSRPSSDSEDNVPLSTNRKASGIPGDIPVKASTDGRKVSEGKLHSRKSTVEEKNTAGTPPRRSEVSEGHKRDRSTTTDGRDPPVVKRIRVDEGSAHDNTNRYPSPAVTPVASSRRPPPPETIDLTTPPLAPPVPAARLPPPSPTQPTVDKVFTYPTGMRMAFFVVEDQARMLRLMQTTIPFYGGEHVTDIAFAHVVVLPFVPGPTPTTDLSKLLDPASMRVCMSKPMVSHLYINDCMAQYTMLALDAYRVTLFEPPIIEIDQVKVEPIKVEREAEEIVRDGSMSRGRGHQMRTPDSIADGPSDYHRHDQHFLANAKPAVERVRQADTEELTEFSEDLSDEEGDDRSYQEDEERENEQGEEEEDEEEDQLDDDDDDIVNTAWGKPLPSFTKIGSAATDGRANKGQHRRAAVEEQTVRDSDKADFAWLKRQLEGWNLSGSRTAFLNSLVKEGTKTTSRWPTLFNRYRSIIEDEIPALKKLARPKARANAANRKL